MTRFLYPTSGFGWRASKANVQLTASNLSTLLGRCGSCVANRAARAQQGERVQPIGVTP